MFCDHVFSFTVFGRELSAGFVVQTILVFRAIQAICSCESVRRVKKITDFFGFVDSARTEVYIIDPRNRFSWSHSSRLRRTGDHADEDIITKRDHTKSSMSGSQRAIPIEIHRRDICEFNLTPWRGLRPGPGGAIVEDQGMIGSYQRNCSLRLISTENPKIEHGVEYEIGSLPRAPSIYHTRCQRLSPSCPTM